jgi:hypothetical protein
MRRNVKRERHAVWDVGLAFGRARRSPTPIDFAPWALLNLRDVFLRGYREGRRTAVRAVQARLPFPSAA